MREIYIKERQSTEKVPCQFKVFNLNKVMD